MSISDFSKSVSSKDLSLGNLNLRPNFSSKPLSQKRLSLKRTSRKRLSRKRISLQLSPRQFDQAEPRTPRFLKDVPEELRPVFRHISYNTINWDGPSGDLLVSAIHKEGLLSQFVTELLRLSNGEGQGLHRVRQRAIWKTTLSVIQYKEAKEFARENRELEKEVYSLLKKACKRSAAIEEKVQLEWFSAWESPESKPLIPTTLSLQSAQLLSQLESHAFSMEKLQNIAAGTRERDPKGQLFIEGVRLLCLRVGIQNKDLKEENKNLLKFLVAWYSAPANADLAFQKPFRRAWRNLGESSEEVKAELPKVTCTKRRARQFHSNPLFEPKCEQDWGKFWQSASAVEELEETLRYWLEDVWLDVTTTDLLHHKQSKPAVRLQEQAERFNLVSGFLVDQILDSSSLEDAQNLVKVLCQVQKRFMKKGAFECAMAVSAAINDTAISRLHTAFGQIPLFEELFDDELNPLSHVKNYKVLRGLIEKGKCTEEPSAIVLRDLTFAKDGNSGDFEEYGLFHGQRLEALGSICNRVGHRVALGRKTWRKKEPYPSRLLIEKLESLRGQPGEDLNEERYQRSQVRRPSGSDQYWEKTL